VKLVRFGQPGSEKPGIIDAQGAIRDLSGIVPDIGGAVLEAASLDRLRKLDLSKLPTAPAGVRLGACVGGARNFYAVGLNYVDHAKETNSPIPKEPILFNKATSCIVGGNDDIMIPRGSVKTDWEVELCVAIGGQWMKGKGCETFGPIGPWLVTADEIKDVQNLSMFLEVNGERVQKGSTSTMIFGVAHIVHYMSQFMVLEPGDLITTGTPPGVGVGFKPPRFLKAGDRMRVGIEGLGEQNQAVVAWR